MQLNSYEFILILLPINLLLYFTLGRKKTGVRKAIICIAGLAFFGFGGIKGLFILLGSMALNILLCELMIETERLRKLLFIFIILSNIAMLFAFKYSNFAFTKLSFVLDRYINIPNPILPLGISFFTFQQIAYAAELYHDNIKKFDLLDYAAYVLYFPKLIMGPIVDPVALIDEINNPVHGKINPENLVSGVKMFSFGLFKKMILADTFAIAVQWGTNYFGKTTSLDMILIMLSYTFRIYFDFSGYSDMATGVSKMMNIELPTNFNSPYKALSVRDFWDRWHMSLTHFMTKYIYYPLGGSNKGKIRTCLNIMIVFIIGGIWHGANWTFMLWGAIYGVLAVIDKIIEPVWKKIYKPIRWLITFLEVNILWLLFSADSISSWLQALKKIILDGTFSVSRGLSGSFRGVEMRAIENLFRIGNYKIAGNGILWMGVYFIAAFAICLLFKNNKELEEKNSFAFLLPAALAFSWAFLSLGTGLSFIYI